MMKLHAAAILQLPQRVVGSSTTQRVVGMPAQTWLHRRRCEPILQRRWSATSAMPARAMPTSLYVLRTSLYETPQRVMGKAKR